MEMWRGLFCIEFVRLRNGELFGWLTFLPITPRQAIEGIVVIVCLLLENDLEIVCRLRH